MGLPSPAGRGPRLLLGVWPVGSSWVLRRPQRAPHLQGGGSLCDTPSLTVSDFVSSSR